MLTLPEFHRSATRMPVEEAERALATDLMTEGSTTVAAWVYAGSCYIEELADGRFHLVIENASWVSDDRDGLADILYRNFYAPEQGAIEAVEAARSFC